MKNYGNIKTFEDLIELEHGKIGTKTRTNFQTKAKSFAIVELIKEDRRLAKSPNQPFN